MKQLQIYVYGPYEEGFLDLPLDASLDIESFGDAFDDNFTVGTFSLPNQFPWTNRNRRLLGFPERLKNNSGQQYWRCTVYDSGLPALENAKMFLIQKKGRYDYTQGFFNVSISGTKGLFGSQVRNKYLKDLNLGGAITWSGKDSRHYAEAVMKGTETSNPYIAFAPVAIENFFDTTRLDYNNEFLAKDRVNNIIVTGSTANAWTFARPQSAYPSLPADSATAEYIDYRTVPFFNLKFVLKKCFEEMGYTAKGDFITTSDFDDLYIFNNFAIEKYTFAYTDYNHTIFPGNHMPPMLITDFLKGCLGLFNIYLSFSGTEVTLVYRKDDFTATEVMSLNDVVAEDFDSSYINQFNTENTTDDVQNQQGGYALNYSWDGNDQYYSDRVKSWLGDSTATPEKNIVATVAKASDLSTLSIGRPLTTNDIAYCQADNLYYQVADSVSIPILWDVYAEGLNSFRKAPGTRSVEFLCSPLCTYVAQNSSTGVYEKQLCVGTRQPGSYFTSKGVQVINNFGLRLFYIKKLTVGGVSLPVSFCHNRDNYNNKILPYSLAWNGEDGLGKNFHMQWQNLQEKLEVAKTSVAISQKVLRRLEQYKKFEVAGIIFFAYKTERTIPLTESMTIYLTPL